MEEQTLTASNSKTSRRHFLDLLLGASVLGWLASIAYPVIRYLKPLPQTGPTGPTHLTREESAQAGAKPICHRPSQRAARDRSAIADQTLMPSAPSAHMKVAP